jgi:hypothetical protein
MGEEEMKDKKKIIRDMLILFCMTLPLAIIIVLLFCK